MVSVIQDNLLSLLCKAIMFFYRRDTKSLWGAKVVDERAMVGCIYRYVWEKRKIVQACNTHDIDIEYDRMTADDLIDNQKAMHSIFIAECLKMNKCERNDLCAGHLDNKIKKQKTNDKTRLLFRPDLIIHNRGKTEKDNNGLIAEFKKENEKHLNRGNVKLDHAKLRFLTCPKAGPLQYKLGAFVMLRKEYADVWVYMGGEVIVGYKVGKSGFRKMTEEEYCGKPWLNQKKAKH